MRIIAIHRHGNSLRDSLSYLGFRQADETGKMLKSVLLPGERAELLSSSAVNAMQDASRIANILGIKSVEENFLWTGAGSVMEGTVDTEAALWHVKASKAEVFVFVTHLEFTQKLPEQIARRLCGLPGNFAGLGNEGIKNGETLLIYLEKKTYSIFQPMARKSEITQ